MAQKVLEHVLQKNRLELSLNRDQELSAAATTAIAPLVERLLRHEPLQYVLGIAHFYGLELAVDERVLIPRPETEELVHLILQEHQGQKNLHILDIGTGSGCIPIALAANLEEAQVYGMDISEGALAVASSNAEKCQVRVSWLLQDIFKPVQHLPPQSLHIITSNPPYVLESEKELMRQNVLAYEPHLALFVPDEDALKYYSRITEVGQALLKKGGKLYFEINERYGSGVKELLLQAGYSSAEVVKDLFGKERMVRGVL